MSTIKIEPVNESALIIYFGTTHSAEVSDEVRNATLSITHYLAPHLLDIVPAYHSILVTFDAGMVSGKHLTEQLQILLQDQPPETTKIHNKHISIPVYYGNDVAWDIDTVGSECGLSVAEVIQLHSGRPYRVFAVGFSPGFGYLGETHEGLSLPRMSTPRLQVPAGSVAISERQTAVYPTSSPGGWHIIGRTPMSMLDWDKTPPARLSVGDEVTFEPISRSEYVALGGQFNDA